MFSFPKSKRLLNRAAFQPAMDSGNKVVCPEMVVLMKESDCLRLGLVVSKKVGNSVVRNRVKRVLRESFRHFAGTAEPSIDSDAASDAASAVVAQHNSTRQNQAVTDLGNRDIVVIARANAAGVSNEVLAQAFEKSLSRLAQRCKREASERELKCAK